MGFRVIKFYCFPFSPPPLSSPPPPPSHFYCYCFPSSSSFYYFPPPPPPPPHSIVFPPPPHSIVFPPLPPPPHFFCFSLLLILLFSILRPLVSFFFSPRDSIKDCQLPSLVHFVAMSRE